MSMIIVKPIDSEGKMEVQDLYNKYSFLMSSPDMKILCFINRVFNTQREVVLSPKSSVLADIIKPEGYQNSKLNLISLLNYGIACGYYVEVIATNFIFRDGEATNFIPILPNEFVADCHYLIKDLIGEEIKLLKDVGHSYEIIGLLYQKKLGNIGDDFREAIIRFENHDYDGSIKFFRKVIEGFRTYVNGNIVVSKNRTDNLKDFITKTFHLMSNFGEHTGTSASFDEAVLSKEITIALSSYLSKKIK
jgi:hypothetical protein